MQTRKKGDSNGLSPWMNFGGDDSSSITGGYLKSSSGVITDRNSYERQMVHFEASNNSAVSKCRKRMNRTEMSQSKLLRSTTAEPNQQKQADQYRDSGDNKIHSLGVDEL